MRIARLLVRGIGIAVALWTIGVSAYIFFTPVQSQVVTHAAFPDGTVLGQEGYITNSLFQREGWLGLLSFVFPIAIAAAGVRAAWRHKQGLLWAMAGAMFLFSFLAGFSIGRAYVPAALALFVAALLNTVQSRLSRQKLASQPMLGAFS